MRVVRQRMIKTFKKNLPRWELLAIVSTLALLSSCNPTEITGTTVRGNSTANTDGSLDNKAYVYKESPYILGGAKYSPKNPNMNLFLDRTAEVITTNTTLTGNCGMDFYFYGNSSVSLSSCIRSMGDKDQAQVVPRNENRTYIFEAGTSEFYQTNALYHIQKGTDTFLSKLSFAYNKLHSLPLTIPKSIPSYLKNSKMFWFKGVSNTDSKQFKYDYLASYSQCTSNTRNASFSPAGPELCFGDFPEFANLYFIQDPSVIYHELAHALVSIMMNMRNGTATTYHPLRSNLGSYGYDEAGSINEGIADYYSYVMNGREHMGEWALGRTANQSRPLSEADSMHISSIEETSEGRLSYPQYLLYDPNYPDSPKEDVHYAGQIITHYLVALTKQLKTTCSISSDTDGGHDRATSYVMLLLAETLSEIGDLNAKGVDDFGVPFSYSIYFNNLNYDSSYLWTQQINPASYRRFSQVMAKNIYKYITGNLCTSFDKNASEKLLDDYGLLLFKTYNNNGNSTTSRSVTYTTAVPYIPAQALTAVSENNRRKSVLVSKELIQLAEKTDANPNRVGFYIIDNRTDMNNLLKDLLFKGFTVPLSTNVASTDYNNSNIKISPGEIVAVIPNLLNNSNSTMAGVHLLATDWDHVDVVDKTPGVPDDITANFKPCVVDDVTTVDQGAEAARTCTSTETDYKRLVKNSTTGLFPTRGVAPVCLVQLEDGDTTRWVSQNEFRKKQGLSLLDKDCLGYSASGASQTDFSFNPHECLVRFLPGANDAHFSKIDAQKTYYESVVATSDDKVFNAGNLLIMEVNKWIPPGTKFRCRMRARFSNCSDCFADSTNSNDDYMDYEFNGSKPYKVINFEFDIND